jgi:hypothetical protein
MGKPMDILSVNVNLKKTEIVCLFPAALRFKGRTKVLAQNIKTARYTLRIGTRKKPVWIKIL